METIFESNPDLVYGHQRYRPSFSTTGEKNAEADSFPPAGINGTGDKVSISRQGKNISTNSHALSGSSSKKPASSENELSLSTDELKLLNTLKRRDKEVRAHEQAHLSVAGQYAGGSASFTTEKGPDGNSYATGGEVAIDLSTGKSPEATITKMQTIKRAALAPANPSPADRMIASVASTKESQARKELLSIDQEKLLQVNKKQTSPSPLSETSPSAGVSIKMMIQAYQSTSSL